ncbi:hypothetical protein AK812_SmicGene48732, partial [Symbiodinium microadriaticum]
VNVIETTEKVVDIPVVKQREVPQVQTIERIVEVPMVPCSEWELPRRFRIWGA